MRATQLLEAKAGKEKGCANEPNRGMIGIAPLPAFLNNALFAHTHTNTTTPLYVLCSIFLSLNDNKVMGHGLLSPELLPDDRKPCSNESRITASEYEVWLLRHFANQAR